MTNPQHCAEDCYSLEMGAGLLHLHNSNKSRGGHGRISTDFGLLPMLRKIDLHIAVRNQWVELPAVPRLPLSTTWRPTERGMFMMTATITIPE